MTACWVLDWYILTECFDGWLPQSLLLCYIFSGIDEFYQKLINFSSVAESLCLPWGTWPLYFTEFYLLDVTELILYCSLFLITCVLFIYASLFSNWKTVVSANKRTVINVSQTFLTIVSTKCPHLIVMNLHLFYFHLHIDIMAVVILGYLCCVVLIHYTFIIINILKYWVSGFCLIYFWLMIPLYY